MFKNDIDKKEFAKLSKELREFLIGYWEENGFPTTTPDDVPNESVRNTCCWKAYAHGVICGNLTGKKKIKFFAELDKVTDSFEVIAFKGKKISHFEYERHFNLSADELISDEL